MYTCGNRWLRRVFALIGFAYLVAVLAATAASALPVAGRYPSRFTALDSPNDGERELLDAINADRRRKGETPLKWEPILSAVAREHSNDMAEHDYVDYFSPRLGSLIYRQHRAGVSAPNSRYAIFRAASVESVVETLQREDTPFHLRPATQIGIGVAAAGFLPRMLYVMLIAGEKHSSLEPFPTMPKYGTGYWLKGTLDPGFEDPHLIVTLPNGEVTETALELDAERRFARIVRFHDGKGEYTVEITATGKTGPMVLELMRCYAGVDYPPPDRDAGNGPAVVDLRRAEKLLLGMLNKARAKAGLPELTYDEKLADVARQHSEDMAENDFFAHISPTRGTLEDRLKRANIAARKFTENLATNTDLQASHDGLMGSPGHRKNILDDEVNRVGVGIVRTREGRLVVTQVFARDFPTYDTATLARALVACANEKRAALGRGALRVDPALERIAAENTKAMAALGRHDHTRAQELLKTERLPFAVQIGVFESSVPIEPEQAEALLEKQYDRIGVAVVQTAAENGAKSLWTTFLLGKK